MRAFISHSTKDKIIADNIVAFLEGSGVVCWIAPRDIMPGINYGAAISQAVRECSVLVLVYSEHSNSSDAVFREVQLAFDSRKPIIPLRIDNTKTGDNLNFYLSGIQWVDAAPAQTDFSELAGSIKELVLLPKSEPVPVPEYSAPVAAAPTVAIAPTVATAPIVMPAPHINTAPPQPPVAPPPAAPLPNTAPAEYTIPSPYHEKPRTQRGGFFIYLAPVVLFIAGVVGFGLIIPARFDETVSFISWLTTNPVNVASMIDAADGIFAQTSSIVIVQVIKYVWLGLFILSLFMLGRRLQAKPVPKSDNAVFTGREPLFTIKEAHSALKLAAGDAQLKDLTHSVRILEEKLAVESDFGVGDGQVILLENEIALQLMTLAKYAAALGAGDYMQLAQAKVNVAQITNLLERRREMKKK